MDINSNHNNNNNKIKKKKKTRIYEHISFQCRRGWDIIWDLMKQLIQKH